MTRHKKKEHRARSKKGAKELFRKADMMIQDEEPYKLETSTYLRVETKKKTAQKAITYPLKEEASRTSRTEGGHQQIEKLKQQMYSNMRQKATSKAIIISDDEEDLPEEIVDARKPDGKILNLEYILQILEELSKVEDPEEIISWFEGHGSTDPINHIARLRNVFKNLTNSLNISTPNDVNTEQQFICRTKDMKLMFLAPFEIFDCDRTVQKKTVAFVRGKGRYHPLMYSFSGWESCTKTHAKMLDARTWTENVVDFCTMYGCELKIGWERGKNLEDVSEIASHAEIKLMLWYAMRLVGKKTKKIPRLEDLMTLQKLRPHPRAEIIISEAPCVDCGIFQDRIQELTGIKFAFYVRDNVGKLKKKKTRSGFREYPIDSSDTEDESEKELRRKYLPKKKSRKSSSKVVETGNVTTFDELALTAPTSTPKKHKNKSKHEVSLHSDCDTKNESALKAVNTKGSKKRKQKHLDPDDSEDFNYIPKTTTYTPVTTPTITPRQRRSQTSLGTPDILSKPQVIIPSHKRLEIGFSPTAAKKGKQNPKHIYFGE